MATVSDFIFDVFEGLEKVRPEGTLSTNMSHNLDGSFRLEQSFLEQAHVENFEKLQSRAYWHFPVWAPDAFAVTSALLERSGTYTRLTPHYIHSELDPREIDRLYKDDGRKSFFRWGHIGRRSRHFSTPQERELFSEDKSNFPEEEHRWRDEEIRFIEGNRGSMRHGIDQRIQLDSQFDPFGVLGANQLELRLAGAMWAYGAVHVSEDLIKAELNPPNIMHPTVRSSVRVFVALAVTIERALNYLELQYPRSIQPRWHDVARAIVRGYRTDNRHKDTFSNTTMLTTRGKEKNSRQPITVSSQHVSYLYNAITQLYPHVSSTKDHFKLSDDAKKELKKLIDEGVIKAEEGDLLKKGRVSFYYLLCKWAIDFIQSRWSFLLLAEDAVSSDLKDIVEAEILDWSAPCFKLMIMADEASASLGFGYYTDPKGKSEPQYLTALKKMRTGRQKTKDILGLEQQFRQADRKSRLTNLEFSSLFPRTLCDQFSSDYGSVLPKSRTSQVGCTLRSMSHHLAFLPPKGRIRARWLAENREYVRQEVKSTVELLLIPYPYAFRSAALKQRRASANESKHQTNWGWFQIDQLWNERVEHLGIQRQASEKEKSNDKMKSIIDEEGNVQFFGVSALVDMLRHSSDIDIDGVVLPELALDLTQYNELSDYLLRSIKIDKDDTSTQRDSLFLIAGAALPEEKPHGFVPLKGHEEEPRLQNSVVMAFDFGSGNSHNPFKQDFNPERPMWDLEWAREKHHRWQLNEWQLQRYALTHRLDPSKVWWEDLAIKSRELGFVEYHPGSVLTALICEDLARIEPAQVALRAIGPNLVFVLLQDGPQLPARWSNQYAGVLADDPGSSVLTISSMGLIHRANATSQEKSRSFALWRDQLGGLTQIDLPSGYHAVNITLKREDVIETTLDLRSDSGNTASVWKLVGVNPIKINRDGLLRGKFGGVKRDHKTGKSVTNELDELFDGFAFEG